MRILRNVRLVLAVVFLVVLVGSATVAYAGGPPTEVPANGNHGVVPLGKAFDVDGREVEGLAIIHYKEAPGKPEGVGKPGKSEPLCYTYLASGAKWRSVEGYIVDSDNNRGLSSDAIESIVSASLAKWETASGAGIFGNLTGVSSDGIDTTAPDGRNEVVFGNWPEPGVIAVTIAWGYFSGPPKWRELVEWDVLFDEVDFNWSTSGEPGKMDFENIATHELGHAAGMGDVYEGVCSPVTMYGYASNGETDKSTLEQPDITGIQKLYSN